MKTKTILLTCGLLLCLQQVRAQAPGWSRLMQTTSYMAPAINCLGGNGDYAAYAGVFCGPLELEGMSMTSVSQRDLFVGVNLVSGEKVWLKHFSSTNGINPLAMKMDASGTLFLFGTYGGTATLGEHTLTGANSFMVSIDADGNIRWAVSFGTMNSGVCQIEVDDQGNSYLAAFTNKLIKFSPDGDIQWGIDFSQGTLQSLSVFGNRLYLGGNLPAGTTTIGPFIFTNSAKTGVILKANLNGEFFDFLKVEGNPGAISSAISVENDDNGNLIFTGGSYGSLSFRGTTWYTHPATYCPYMALCDTTLNVLWAHSGESTTSACTNSFRLFRDNSSNIFLYGSGTGFQFGSVFIPGNPFILRCDPAGQTEEVIGINNSISPYVLATGDYLMAARYGGEAPDLFNNLYIRKYNWPYNLEWQKITTGNQGGSVRTNFAVHDKKGYLYSSSRVSGTFDYFGKPIQANAEQTLFARFDPAGKLLWSQAVTDQLACENYPFGRQINCDNEGNLVSSGQFYNQLKLGSFTLVDQNLNPDGYVVRFSPEGEAQWVTQLEASHQCNINGTVFTPDGEVIVTGYYAGFLKVGNVTMDGGPNQSVFVVKLDQQGNLVWAKAFPGELIYLAMPAIDPDGNIFVACEFYNSTSGSITFGSVTTPQGPDDGGTVLVKLDPAGTPLWVHTYGGSALDEKASGWPTDIKTDAQGNCYLWGWCWDQALFGTTTFTNPFTVTNASKWNYYLTKTDPAGQVIWSHVIFEKNYSFNYGDMLDVDNNGNVYVAGHFKDSIDVSGNRFQPESVNDFFVIKYSKNGVYQWIKTLPAGGNNFNSLSVLKENSLTISGMAGMVQNFGAFPVINQGGGTSVMATLGDLLPHFVPVWSGNGVDQMNINIYSAMLDGLNLEAGDEIGVFDGELCVGAGVVDQTITSGHLLNLVVSRDDGSGNGYTPGHPITFRYYDLSAGREVTRITATYSDENPTWSTDGLFAIGATAFAALNGKTTSLLTLPLLEGWNLISSNVTPDEPDMEVLFQPLILPSQLLKVMDEAGNAMENLGSFGGWQNAIGDLALTEGYKVKVTTGCQMTLEGEPAAMPMDIPLSTGWNIIGFPYPWSVTATDIVQQLITRGTLIKVQDEAGRSIEDFGSFGGWVNNIGSFQPGKGYKVKVNAPDVLNLPELIFKSAAVPLTEVPTRHLIPVFQGNGVDHMNINLVGLSSGFLRPGDELGVFDGELCVGALTLLPRHLEARLVSIPTSAAEPGDNTGFTEGHPIRLQLWKATTGEIIPLEAEIIRGSSSFRKNESLLATLQKYAITTTSLEEASATSIYPNPTTGKVTIRVSGRATGEMEVCVLNPAGQTVMTCRMTASQGEVDLSGNAPGIYTIRVKHDGGCLTQRITLQ